MTERYKVIRVSPHLIQTNLPVRQFCLEVAIDTSTRIAPEFDWRKFDILQYAKINRIMMCLRDDKPVGLMLSSLSVSQFDDDIKILNQDLLYAKSGTRAARLLLDEFIDFGRSNAQHLITMIAPLTNIKPSSLKRLGFQELETLYRLEVK